MADVAFYENMAAVALQLIRDFGRDDLVLTRQAVPAAPGGYDPVEDTEAPGGLPTETPIVCVVLPVTTSNDNTRGSGSLIEANKRLLKIAADGLLFEPSAGDSIQFEGSTWIALGATPISPAGIPLVFNVTVERG